MPKSIIGLGKKGKLPKGKPTPHQKRMEQSAEFRAIRARVLKEKNLREKKGDYSPVFDLEGSEKMRATAAANDVRRKARLKAAQEIGGNMKLSEKIREQEHTWLVNRGWDVDEFGQWAEEAEELERENEELKEKSAGMSAELAGLLVRNIDLGNKELEMYVGDYGT